MWYNSSVALFKKKKAETGGINFNNIFYLIQSIIFTFAQYKKIVTIFYIQGVFCTFSTSPCGAEFSLEAFGLCLDFINVTV